MTQIQWKNVYARKKFPLFWGNFWRNSGQKMCTKKKKNHILLCSWNHDEFLWLLSAERSGHFFAWFICLNYRRTLMIQSLQTHQPRTPNSVTPICVLSNNWEIFALISCCESWGKKNVNSKNKKRGKGSLIFWHFLHFVLCPLFLLTTGEWLIFGSVLVKKKKKKLVKKDLSWGYVCLLWRIQERTAKPRIGQR